MINARDDAHRHRRTDHEPGGVPATCSPQRGCEICQLDITHCGGLDRSPPHRRAGRGPPHRPGAAQSARARQHRGVAGVRLLAAELHHLRNGPQRRALAAGRGGGGLHRRAEGPHRPAQHAARTGHHDQRSRSEEASVPAGIARSGCSTPTAAWAIGEGGRGRKSDSDGSVGSDRSVRSVVEGSARRSARV